MTLSLSWPCPVVWWDQDKLIWFRWCQACVAATRWGVQRQVCLAYSQAWWWECHGLGLELWFIEGTKNANMYCDIPKQSMIPCLQILGHRAVFQHNDDHCLAKEAEGKDDGLAKHVSRPKPYWASNGRWRSASSLTSTSSVMSSWRSGRGLQWQPVKLWWTPCPRGPVLENNDGHTKYWHFGPNLDIFTYVCTHFCDQRFRH